MLWFSPIGTGRVRVKQTTTGAIQLIYLVGATEWFYNAGTSAWQNSAATAYAGAVGTFYKARIKKDTLNYTFAILSDADAVLVTASVAIATVTGTAQEMYVAGDDGGGGYQYTARTYDLAGVYSGATTGIITNIVKQNSKPFLYGDFVDALTNEVYDEENVRGQNLAYSYQTLSVGGAWSKVAMGFKIRKEARLKKARVFLKKAAPIAAGKKIWVEIWSDDGTGLPLAKLNGYTSSLFEANDIQATDTFADFSFSNAPALTVGTQYHLVLTGDTGVALEWKWFEISSYPRGIESHWTGASWEHNTVGVVVPRWLIFGLKFEYSDKYSYRISYLGIQTYKTLTSKTDFEGNNESAASVDTATKSGYVLLAYAGAYAASGTIQNDIDLGSVPVNFCTLSLVHYARTTGQTITVEVAASDDNITYPAVAAAALTNGVADLTAFGKHRYWRVKATLATTDTTKTPELHSWTIDAFPPLAGFSKRDKLEPKQYAKVEVTLTSENPEDSILLDGYSLSYRIAYELFIKKVTYKISSDGITADMQLSSE